MKRWWSVIGAFVLLLAWAKWAPMDPLFDDPRSTVLLDRHGGLLAASVAADHQWRMPAGDSLPLRFEQCLLEFEDRHFRSHWGIHLPSLVRAAEQNRSAGRVVSGGSTLTMQLARMAGGARSRSVWNKLREMLFALRLELRYTKDELLSLYAANAPFGGNVVGLEAAAWRWFGRPPSQLSWAESATLAVLPNAPSQLHPGKGRQGLKAKRDRLLDRLLATMLIDTTTWSLAKEVPLPERPHQLPDHAVHLLSTVQLWGLGGTK
ncbi:MAG: transglycosylase domain-containing protein, partial [Flavobacteriales bacterium]